MVQDAGLVDPKARALGLTAGCGVLQPGSLGALQVLLFQALFWWTDVSPLVG